MTLEQAINNIHAPHGVSSIIAGIVNDDYSVLRDPKAVATSVVEIEHKVKGVQRQLDECKSDWAYWSILGELSYWRATLNIYKAAEIVGFDKLADIPAPTLEGISVMDAIARVEKYGKDILSHAQQSQPC